MKSNSWPQITAEFRDESRATMQFDTPTYSPSPSIEIKRNTVIARDIDDIGIYHENQGPPDMLVVDKFNAYFFTNDAEPYIVGMTNQRWGSVAVSGAEYEAHRLAALKDQQIRDFSFLVLGAIIAIGIVAFVWAVRRWKN